MNWEDYTLLIEKVLKKQISNPEYDAKMGVIELNKVRTKRWIKTLEIKDEIKQCLTNISSPQNWILIVEPWCSDAANILPVIYKMSLASPKISLDIQLRDSPPFLIEQYLSGGSKAIPKLIVRDIKGQDLFTWGARPLECQQMVLRNKTLDIPDIEKKALIQKWYNQDKGVSIQNEIIELLKKLNQLDKVCLSK